MHERIRELATQVGISVDYLTNTKQIVLIDAFAQLIIKECIQAVYDDGQDAEYYQHRIKQHFGVKE